MSVPKPIIKTVELDLGDFGWHEVDVHFFYEPEERQTYDCPGWPEEYSIECVMFYGKDVSEHLPSEAFDAIEKQLKEIREEGDY